MLRFLHFAADIIRKSGQLRSWSRYKNLEKEGVNGYAVEVPAGGIFFPGEEALMSAVPVLSKLFWRSKVNDPGVAYRFSWNHLGDIAMARPHIGADLPVAVYRLMQYTLRHVLADRYGDEGTRDIMREAGGLAGEEFCKNLLDTSLAFPEFMAQLQELFRELRLGILRVEQADFDTPEMVITVSEDVDCSGLPVLGVTVCDYDEGFLAGVLKCYTGKDVLVREIDCWATGDRTCRFDIRPPETPKGER